jgi:hypothetical protein
MKPHQIGIVIGIALVLVLSAWVVWRARAMMVPTDAAPHTTASPAAPHAH